MSETYTVTLSGGPCDGERVTVRGPLPPVLCLADRGGILEEPDIRLVPHWTYRAAYAGPGLIRYEYQP